MKQKKFNVDRPMYTCLTLCIYDSKWFCLKGNRYTVVADKHLTGSHIVQMICNTISLSFSALFHAYYERDSWNSWPAYSSNAAVQSIDSFARCSEQTSRLILKKERNTYAHTFINRFESKTPQSVIKLGKKKKREKQRENVFYLDRQRHRIRYTIANYGHCSMLKASIYFYGCH